MNTHIWAAGVLVIFILMEYAEKYLGYGMLTLVYLLVFWVMPNKIYRVQGWKRKYGSWRCEENNKNPLYAKGCFRKKTGKTFLPKLKGLFLIKTLTIFLGIIPFTYEITMCSRGIYYDWFERILLTGAQILIVGYFVCMLYYEHQYKKGFKYTENSRGIWQPFSYINPFVSKGRHERFRHMYDMGYTDIEACTGQNCINKNYQFVKKYFIPEGGECVIYMRPSQEELRIFKLIHIEKYSDEKMQELNEIFEDFWLEYVDKKCRTESVSLIFLLCVDEYDAEIRDRLLSESKILLKKGRYRLPAVVVFSEKTGLVIFEQEGVFYKEKYKEMREELLQLLKWNE